MDKIRINTWMFRAGQPIVRALEWARLDWLAARLDVWLWSRPHYARLPPGGITIDFPLQRYGSAMQFTRAALESMTAEELAAAMDQELLSTRRTISGA